MTIVSFASDRKEDVAAIDASRIDTPSRSGNGRQIGRFG
jgi:hypothetical protein